MKDELWHVYIIECSLDGSFYTGITNNLEKRLKAHSEGRGARYTKGRGPFKLLITFEMPNKSQALREEARIKKLSKQDKIKLIGENHENNNF